MILVDTRSAMFTPLLPGDPAHLYSHLVFAANGSAVDTTIVDGRILMRGRELTHRGRGGRPGPGQPGPAAHRRGHRLPELTLSSTGHGPRSA